MAKKTVLGRGLDALIAIEEVTVEGSSSINEIELDKILKFYQAKKIVFGHTINDNIKKDYKGKLINIDVAHGQEKNSDNTKGLLIENGNEFIINGKGKKSKL